MAETFEMVRYRIGSPKLLSPVRILLLGDLHMTEHGPRNAGLLDAVREESPDLVLCTGDMINCSEPERSDVASDLFRELAAAAPVCAVNGNHETKVKMQDREAYDVYMKKLRGSRVNVLNNRSMRVRVNGNAIDVTGLELPRSCYRKFRRHALRADVIRKKIGVPHEGVFTVLLAHNPYFAETYFEWGADLTLSGHNHGGVMRIGRQSLLSPYGYPLPRYGYGHFEKDGRHLVITSGLGEHTIPFRIMNPMEAVLVEASPL